ncbi:MAG: TonB-dependent receptor [Myxococcota bacterium]
MRGLYVSDDLNYSHIGVRGMSRPGDYSSLVLVLVDGHRTNEPLFDEAPLGRMLPVDVQLIDRVEVIRGPTSSLYGTNAMLAVLNVITKRGRDLDGVHLGIEAQTDGALLGRVAAGARLGSDLEVAFGAALFHDGGHDLYFPGLGHARGLDTTDSFGASLKVGWRQLTLIADFGRARRGIATASYGTVFGTDRSWTDDTFFFTELKYADHVTASLDLTARLMFDDYDYDGQLTFDYSDAGDGSDLVANHDLGSSDSVGAEVQADLQASDALRFSLGAELKHSLSVFQKNYDREVYLDDDRHPTYAGTFLQGEWQIVPALTLDAALRLDGYASIGAELSPRAALIARPGDSTTLKALVGRAFRAPNQYELHYRDGASAKPPGHLDPEHITHYELVWEQRISAPLRLVVSGFRWRMDDLLSFTTDPADGLLVFENRDSASAWGLEAQLDASWAGGYSASLSYAFADARDERGVWLVSSPRHMLKLQAGLPLIGEKLGVGLECQLMSARKTLTGSETAPVALVNLSLSSRGLVRGLRLSATAFNLLDQAYGDPASEEHVQSELPQARLRVSFTATYSF